MATYSHTVQGLYIDTENAKRLTEDTSPKVVIEVELISDTGEVDNIETMEYYVLGDDLLVLSNSSQETVAYIINDTAYGEGHAAIRDDIHRFIELEKNQGRGHDMRLSAEKIHPSIEVSFPITINRETPGMASVNPTNASNS